MSSLNTLSKLHFHLAFCLYDNMFKLLYFNVNPVVVKLYEWSIKF